MEFNGRGFSSPSNHCDTVDTPAPPPDPIENIYNTSSDVLNVLIGSKSQVVNVSVRLELIGRYLCNILLVFFTHSVSVGMSLS